MMRRLPVLQPPRNIDLPVVKLILSSPTERLLSIRV